VAIFKNCFMAFSKSVQFRGIKNVVKAYTNKNVPAWGLWQGTQFLEKYEGADIEEGATLLQDYLQALDQRSNDTNTYTLCVYDVPKGTKITSASKYDASFNFRILDTIEDHYQNKMGGALDARISGLEEKLDAVLHPAESEVDEKPDAWFFLTKLFEHPQIQQVLITKVLGLVDGVSNMFTGGMGAARPAQAIGSADNSETEKLQTAVGILAGIDPQLGSHLLALAQIAQKDPGKYNSLIGMLNLL
jgi:hypothetical protein